MPDEIFRQKSLNRIKSPEDLNDYVRVANPGIWMVLAAAVILLAGVCLTEAPYGKEKKNARESGTYDELIENNGKFAELVERQRLDVEAD